MSKSARQRGPGPDYDPAGRGFRSSGRELLGVRHFPQVRHPETPVESPAVPSPEACGEHGPGGVTRSPIGDMAAPRRGDGTQHGAPGAPPGATGDTSIKRLPDTELISRCLSGEAAAWDALIERYAPLVHTVALRMGLSEPDSADVLQEVCLILLDHLADLRNRSRLAAWIVSTTRREVWRLRRRRGPRLLSELSDSDQMAVEAIESAGPGSSVEESFVALEQAFEVRQALEVLPERCRGLLAGLYLHDPPLSYAEVGELLGMMPASVGPTRTRCLARLRSILESMGFQP